MERQLIVRPEGDNFRVVFHNYMGPFEGRQIGKWLHLEEADPPDTEDGYGPIQLGQYYMWHAMQKNPDLHALVPGNQLKDVATAVDHFHVRVVEGEPFLPELSEEERETPPEPPETSYIELIEKEHQSVWTKGPKAIFFAFLWRAIPAAIIVLAVVVASRHFGDHRQEVGLDAIFAKAGAPVRTQSAMASFWNPDHSHELRSTITTVRCMTGERLILADGKVLRFAGMRDVAPMLEAARDNYAVPRMDIDIVDRKAMVQQIAVGEQIFGREVELIRLTKLPPTADAPIRSHRPLENQWLEVTNLVVESQEELRALVGQRISLLGTLKPDDDGYLFESAGGSLALLPVSENRGLGDFLTEFADGAVELRVDLVIDELLPAKSGHLGSGKFYSVSAQNYHIVARR